MNFSSQFAFTFIIFYKQRYITRGEYLKVLTWFISNVEFLFVL